MCSAKPSEDILREFGDRVYSKVFQEVPFGSLSKSELELAIFSALVDSKGINPDQRPFKLARLLRCTPARASSLVFNYRLRTPSTEQGGDELVGAISVVRDLEAAKKKKVVINVEQRFWREVLISKLEDSGVFTDSSFNRERLTMDEDSFIDACEKLFGEPGKEIVGAVKKSKKKGSAEAIQDLLAKVAVSGAVKAGGTALAMSLPTIISALQHMGV